MVLTTTTSVIFVQAARFATEKLVSRQPAAFSRREPFGEMAVLRFKRLSLAELGLTELPTHPVSTALSREYVLRLNHFLAAAETMSGYVNAGKATSLKCDLHAESHALQELVEHGEAVLELAPWIENLRSRFLRHLGDFESAEDIHPFAKVFFRGLAANPPGQSRRGRPNQFPIYIDIFELMLSASEMSLGKAREKLGLPKGKEASLKTGIIQLKKVLRKYAPEYVEKYDGMHPDRAKKVNR
jgi:hypothetical protein